ncbi:MAG TPA: FlgD immunoglobulin-like domain containing protein [Candidatus Krumholzibacteria bacterium]|nr:FlgD immunoglobulin-like domain containing protein [Candidatus Krumholzibacteria bacterium]
MTNGPVRGTIAAVMMVFASLPAPGRAAPGDITLLGQLLPAGMDEICDVWGYVDPNGIHYAIMGDWGNHLGGGVYIINVEDPTNPFLAKAIAGNGSYGFDVKVWDHYVYACNGSGSGTTSRVYDITDIQNPVVSAAFPSHHNLTVHPDGYLYGEVPGLVCYDIGADPMVPAFEWLTDVGNGHDSYAIGDILYDFHGYTGTNLYDISNRLSPSLLGSITDGTITYHHSGCPTEDGQYLYLCDELATSPTPDVTVWNITNPATPAKVKSFGDSNATVHNLYIIGDFAFVSYYSAGFRVYDVSDPLNPVLRDTYDTNASTGENYDGNFGVYPFADNGVIYVSDWDNGLFLFSVEGFPPATAVRDPAPQPADARLLGNFPNPFNPSTRVSYELGRESQVSLAIYDATGRLVTTLYDGTQPAGQHDVQWNGTDRSGVTVASGVYFARLRVDGHADTRRMVLLK